MPDSASPFGVIENVNDGPGGVRDRNFDMGTPHRMEAEERAVRYFAEGKSRLIYEEFTLADRGSRENGDVAKDLFGEAPMLTGAPSGNVAWFE